MRCTPLVLALVLWCEFSLAQTQPSASVLRGLTQQAGYVFAGTVLAVIPQPSGSVPTVAITFKVDRGVRGVRTGQALSIREWAGLWNSTPRYRPGQRVFLFLYPPSKLGLTSPVQGALGHFAVDPSGAVIIDRGLTTPAQDPKSARSGARISVRELARAVRHATED